MDRASERAETARAYPALGFFVGLSRSLSFLVLGVMVLLGGALVGLGVTQGEAGQAIAGVFIVLLGGIAFMLVGMFGDFFQATMDTAQRLRAIEQVLRTRAPFVRREGGE